MSHRVRLGLVLGALSLGACATLPESPKWFDGCRRDAPGGERYFCGEASAASPEAAREAAKLAAQQSAAGEIATEVSGRLRMERGCESVSGSKGSSGECRERIDSVVESNVRSLTFSGIRQSRQDVKPQGGGLHRAWVEVAIPSAQWLDLQKQASGKTLLVIDCARDGAGCPRAIRDQLTAAISACEKSPSVEVVDLGASRNASSAPPDEDPWASQEQKILSLTSDRVARWVLYVSVYSRPGRAADGLVTAEGAGQWSLMDTVAKSGRQSASLPARQAVALDAVGAAEKALRDAVERLRNPSCGLSDAAGSLCCRKK